MNAKKYLEGLDVISLFQYLVVCIVSAAISVFAAIGVLWKHRKKFCQGRAWIELDRKALWKNVRSLRSMLPNGCELMPAVKAEAYGHGAALIAGELNRAGVKAFCVASVLEGVDLRKKGVKGKILVLGYTHPAQFVMLRHHCLIQTVVDYSYAQELNKYGKTLRVHVGIDTGMHRLGERSDNQKKIEAIFQMNHLKIEGMYTHLCTVDSSLPEDRAYAIEQARAFYQVEDQLAEKNLSCSKVHLLSSYGVLNYPALCGDYARVGIAIYGVLSTKEDTDNCRADLKPVLSLKARIAAVKELHGGEGAGYGLQFVASREMKIAVASIGYADGIPRSLFGGKVLVNGCEAPVIGRICMDQMLLDVSSVSKVKAGDIAVIIGKSGSKEITAGDLAKSAGTITNEVLSRLGSRLERVLI